MNDKPALLGGAPLHTPFPRHTTDIGQEEKNLVNQVLDSQVLSGFAASLDERFSGGPMVRRLETEVAAYYGMRHALSFNSATSALHAAVAACGVGPGDEVITTPTTMSATASAILHTNAVPVFADIEETTFGLDPDQVRRRMSPRTRAILATNLFGHGARLEELAVIARDHNLIFIEDNCHAPGVLYRGRLTGTFGAISILSLNYHKIFQCGEGGMALTDDDGFALKMKLIRNHGESVVEGMGIADIVNTLGWNYRMTEIQAAVAIAQFAKMDRLNQWRQELALALTRTVAPFDFLTPPTVETGCGHCYYLYPLRYDATKAQLPRRLFCEALKAENFLIMEGYVTPLHLQPLYRHRLAYGMQGCPFTCPLRGNAPVPTYGRGDCPVAERLWQEAFIVCNFAKFPNSVDDMACFGRAVARIIAHRDELIAWDRSRGTGA